MWESGHLIDPRTARPGGLMARTTSIPIANYRSIGAPVEIIWPATKPVVLLGQNNAGKSNVVKARPLIGIENELLSTPPRPNVAC